MYLICEKKLEYPEKTFACTGTTCKLHKKRPHPADPAIATYCTTVPCQPARLKGSAANVFVLDTTPSKVLISLWVRAELKDHGMVLMMHFVNVKNHSFLLKSFVGYRVSSVDSSWISTDLDTH